MYTLSIYLPPAYLSLSNILFSIAVLCSQQNSIYSSYTISYFYTQKKSSSRVTWEYRKGKKSQMRKKRKQKEMGGKEKNEKKKTT